MSQLGKYTCSKADVMRYIAESPTFRKVNEFKSMRVDVYI